MLGLPDERLAEVTAKQVGGVEDGVESGPGIEGRANVGDTFYQKQARGFSLFASLKRTGLFDFGVGFAGN